MKQVARNEVYVRTVDSLIMSEKERESYISDRHKVTVLVNGCRSLCHVLVPGFIDLPTTSYFRIKLPRKIFYTATEAELCKWMTVVLKNMLSVV